MRHFYLFLLLLFLPGCAVIRHSAKYDFGEGVYFGSLLRLNSSRKFVAETKDKDTITVMPILRDDVFDSIHKLRLPAIANKLIRHQYFFKPSFDLDVVTIPFKYRPVTEGFPRQLNANYNAALYLGYRTDAYRVSFKANHLGGFSRQVTHVGFSLGAFAGIGATAMNPWVTNNKIDIEYDGFIISEGLAAIIAINNLSAGIGLGYDRLTDRNKQVWIYQGKPWIGLLLGLNLN